MPPQPPPAVLSREVRRVTLAGLGANFVLAIVKFAAGYFGSSRVMMADAIHSLSDSITDIAILIGVRYWTAPADYDHPHGHRRIETLISVLIGAMVGAVAVGLAWDALRIFASGAPRPAPRVVAVLAGLASIVCKETLFQWTLAVGRRVHSSALIANAWHHRSDGISSIPATLAVLGGMANPNWRVLDQIGTLIVAVFILKTSWDILRPALGQLIDTGAPPDACRRIEGLAAGVDEVRGVHSVRTRYIGSGVAVDLHIEVQGAETIREGHRISHEVKRRLLEEGPEVVDVTVHLEPWPRKGAPSAGSGDF